MSAAAWAAESRPAANGSSAALGATLAAQEPSAVPGSARYAESPSAAACGPSALAVRAAPDHVRCLTAREVRMIDLVSLGLSTAEVVRALGGSTAPTLRAHMQRLRSVLEAPNRAALVAAGFRFGLLTARPWPVDVAVPSLRPAQVELLPLLVEGLTDERIADRLSSSVPVYAPAVRSRMTVLRRGLGAASRSHVVRLAVEAGLLVVSPDGERLVLAEAGGAA